MRIAPGVTTLLITGLITGAIALSGSGMTMAQTKGAPSASLAVARAGAPLEVTVTANGGGVTYFGGVFIEFGDGKRQLLCGPGQGCRELQVQHRYEKAGTYKVKLVGLGEPEQKPLAEATVTVPGN